MSGPHLSTVLSSKGQVVIPKDLRKSLGLREGDRLEIDVDPKRKHLILRKKPRSHWRELRGAFGPVNQTTSEILAEGRAEERARESRF